MSQRTSFKLHRIFSLFTLHTLKIPLLTPYTLTLNFSLGTSSRKLISWLYQTRFFNSVPWTISALARASVILKHSDILSLYLFLHTLYLNIDLFLRNLLKQKYYHDLIKPGSSKEPNGPSPTWPELARICFNFILYHYISLHTLKTSLHNKPAIT